MNKDLELSFEMSEEEKEIIQRAETYIDSAYKKIKENKREYIKHNKKAISDCKELDGYVSIYKFGAAEYRLWAYKHIKSIFGGR